MNKQAIRDALIVKRKMLSRVEYDLRNRLIYDQLIQLPEVLEARVIHSFLTMPQFQEPDTRPFLESFANQKELCIPRVTGNSMEQVRFTPELGFKKSKLGVAEPLGGELVQEESIDAVLVPLVTFDRLGNRLGYGKAFYDGFLSRCRPGTVKIGLSLAPPLDLIPELEAHDVPLTVCVSPWQTYRFSGL